MNEYENSKHPSDSEVIMTELVLPDDTNLLGNLLGGKIMHWIDIAAALAASKHSNKAVATVVVDNIEFRHPIKLGSIVTFKAKLIWVGRTSMEVKIKVYGEDFKNSKKVLTNMAYFTFVALDEDGNPVPVPRLIPVTEEEKEDYQKAEMKRKKRLS
jgi:acyl-CoA hydrolase